MNRSGSKPFSATCATTASLAASMTVMVGLMIAPPTWPTPGRGPVCGPMLVTKSALQGVAEDDAARRPAADHERLPAVGAAADDVVGGAGADRRDDLVLGRAAGRDVDDRDVGALDVRDVEPRVGGVGRHAARVDADVDAADEHRRVAVAAGDVEHLHLVEVLVAEVGARAGAVELDLRLHAQPPGIPSAAPVTRSISVSVAGSMIETESAKRFTTQARGGPPVVEHLDVERVVADGDALDARRAALGSTNCPCRVVDPELVALLGRDVELRRAGAGADVRARAALWHGVRRRTAPYGPARPRPSSDSGTPGR